MLPVGQHTLTTPIDSDALKHCILVKLTDSSAKFIQEFLKTKDALNKKPTITFNDNNRGEITFPSTKSQDTFRKFQFSLSSIKGAKTDGTASFECVSYSSEDRLRTIGTMDHKLTIQANAEESFQMTKDRVTVIAEEEKKMTTKELKPNSSSSSNSNRNSINHNRSKSASGKSVTTLKPSANSTSSLATTQTASKQTNKSNERPLRERVVHILGLKPYTRSEILLRLAKDGISDREKESLDSLLQSIGSLNQKTQQYDLQNDVLLAELKDDWSYYSSAERQLAKRALLNAKSSKSLNPHKQQSAFVAFNSSQREPPAVAIQQSSSLLDDFGLNMSTATKQQVQQKKVSPKSIDAPFRPIGSSSASSTSSSNSSLKTSPKVLNGQLHVTSVTPPSTLLQQTLNVSPPNQTHAKRKQPQNARQQQQQQQSQQSTKENKDHLNGDLNVFYKKYAKLTCDEQRNSYKHDFESLYDEYYELHTYIDSINSIFVKYQHDIQKISTNSREYDNLEETIKREYMNKQNDKEYCEKRDRYNELYSKLKYIETQIHNYDAETSKITSD